MRALSLHGPWAYYERQNASNEARIAQLQAEVWLQSDAHTGTPRSQPGWDPGMRHWLISPVQVDRWRQDAEAERADLSASRADNAQLRDHSVPTLQREAAQARDMISQLQAELVQSRDSHEGSHLQLTEKLRSITEELQRVNADNAVLRGELAKTVHARTTTASKLDHVRKKLGLTESEAKVFIQVWSWRFLDATLRMRLTSRMRSAVSLGPAAAMQGEERSSIKCRAVICKKAWHGRMQLLSSRLAQMVRLHAHHRDWKQELDDTRTANKSLTEENATLAADKAHLQQQVESRSQHCMTLITENKRLIGQVGGRQPLPTAIRRHARLACPGCSAHIGE
jgi:hypothetical protein